MSARLWVVTMAREHWTWDITTSVAQNAKWGNAECKEVDLADSSAMVVLSHFRAG